MSLVLSLKRLVDGRVVAVPGTGSRHYGLYVGYEFGTPDSSSLPPPYQPHYLDGTKGAAVRAIGLRADSLTRMDYR